MADRINVTKTFMPPFEEYERYLRRIWESGYLTNQGPLLQEFESLMKSYLAVSNFQFVSNGTMALQLALRALGVLEGEVITTPFTYVATSSAILWERCKPVYVDIDARTLCMEPKLIEAAITSRTRAIMPVHVFGNPCDVDTIEEIAKRHDIPVIYDAAHAFGGSYNGRSLLSYGDISVTSFHATKLFHTIEGGGAVVKDRYVSRKYELAKRFGHDGDEHLQLGINAKANEFSAAMGLVNFHYLDENIAARKQIAELYDKRLPKDLVAAKPAIRPGTNYNYSYYPVVFESESKLLEAFDRLRDINVFPRRYFYPSLTTLEYVESQSCPAAEDIAPRVACLPLYPGLSTGDVERICREISR